MTQKRIPPSEAPRIVAVVNRHGLVKAAAKLDIPQSTLCVFLQRHGYVRKAQYVQEVQIPQTT